MLSELRLRLVNAIKIVAFLYSGRSWIRHSARSDNGANLLGVLYGSAPKDRGTDRPFRNSSILGRGSNLVDGDIPRDSPSARSECRKASAMPVSLTDSPWIDTTGGDVYLRDSLGSHRIFVRTYGFTLYRAAWRAH